MAPLAIFPRQGPLIEGPSKEDTWNWRKVAGDEDLVLESWSQGFVVGGLMLMGCITIANMRRGVILHKLIFLEQLMALTHGTFCFMNFKGYGWYLSSTAALLYLSYILHNVVAWMKVKPFFHGKSTIFEPTFVKWTTIIYTYSLACTVPPVLFQITDNFRFFSGYGGWYTKVRPYEPLMRDPWWVFCCGILFYVISKSYGMGVFQIIRRSPRFGILFVSIILALIFTALDIVASLHPFIGSTDGINPFWKLALVFKCLTDAILLDDFKTELKRLGLRRMKRDEKRRESHALVLEDEYLIDSDDEANAHYSNGTANGNMNGHAYQSPASYPNRNKSIDMEQSEEVEFMQALNTHPSQLSSDRESRRESRNQRHQIGRGGTPARKLPKLFAAITPGRRSKKSADEDAIRNDSVFTQSESSEFDMTSKSKKQKRRNQEQDDLAPDEVRCEDDALAQARREQQRTIAELKARQNSVATAKKASPLRSISKLSEEIALTDQSSSSSDPNDYPANSGSLPDDSVLRELSTHRTNSAGVDMGSVSTNSIMERRGGTLTHRGSVSNGKSTADLIRQHVQQQQQKKKSVSRDFWNGLDDLDENGPSKPHNS